MLKPEESDTTTSRNTLENIRDSIRDIEEAIDERSSNEEGRGRLEDLQEERDYRSDDGEALSLASFELSNGNEIRIVGSPTAGELMVGEIAPCGAEHFAIPPTMHPVEVFRLLAPKHSPAPRMLHAIDRAGLLEGRMVVDTLDRAVGVSVDQISTQPTPRAVGAGSCQPGAAGADYFEDNHCGALGGPGYGTSESYCYKGSYDWIQRTSSSKRRATYSRMAACGTGTSRFRHYYKKAGGYHAQLTVYVDAETVSNWWSYRTGIKRYRRVRFEAVDPGAWVRGWVIFHSQVADGW